MNSEAYKENIRTLAQVLSTSEQNAADLLNGKIAVMVHGANQFEVHLADYLVMLLGQTVENVQKNPGDLSGFDLVVNIGEPTSMKVDLFIRISSSQLVIQGEPIGMTSAETESGHLWSLVGACYSAAQCMRLLVGAGLPVTVAPSIQVNYSDLFDDAFSETEPFDIGTVWLAGAGAIGNAFVFALSLMNPVGELNIADPDRVEGGNLNRCLCFNNEDLSHNKAERLAIWATPRFKKLTVVPHPTELAKVRSRNDGAWLERLVVAVDSRRVRRHLQNEIPGEVFDASTTDVREIVLHFNRQPLRGLACMSCIYFQNPAENAHEQHVAEALGVSVNDVRSHFVSASAARRIVVKYPHIWQRRMWATS